MELIIRVFLFYVLEMFYNKLIVPERINNSTQNSTLFNAKSTLIGENSTLLATKNSTFFNETEPEFDFLANLFSSSFSVWHFLRILTGVLDLMFLLALVTPTKYWRRWFLLTLVGTSLISLAGFICQMDLHYVAQDDIATALLLTRLILRFFFFSIVSLIITFQLINLDKCTKTLLLVNVIFCLLLTINPLHVEYQLAKYLLSAWLFSHLFPQNERTTKAIANTIALLLVCFILIHTSPLLLQSVNRWADNWDSSDWTPIVHNEGFVVLRVAIVWSLLAFTTIGWFVGVNWFLSIKQNFVVIEALFSFLTFSPAFFLTFAMDNYVWNAEPESIERYMQLYFCMHFASLFAATCEPIKTVLMAKPEPGDEVKATPCLAFYLNLVMLLCATFNLVFSWWTFSSDDAPPLIIAFFAVYSLVQVVLTILGFLFTRVPPANQSSNAERHLKTIDMIDFHATMWLYFCNASAMLAIFIHQDSGLSLLIGALYYLLLSVRRAKLQLFKSQNEVCAICHENMTFGCVTTCKHYYHEQCISAWLKRSNKCPLCNYTLGIFDVV